MEIESALAPATTLDLTANVGDVDLALPSDTRAHVEATTSQGDTNVSGFAYATGALTSSHVISTDLNPNPQSMITAHVSTGDLRLHASAHAGA
jgi:predicted membrane protein